MTTYLQSVEAGVHIQHAAGEMVMAEVSAELHLFITDASSDALARVHEAIMNRDYATMFTILAEMVQADPTDDSLPDTADDPPARRGRRITV